MPEAAGRKAPGALVLADLPPPVNGMTMVTAAAVELLRTDGSLAGVLAGSWGRRGPDAWHRARRQATLLGQVLWFPRERVRGRRRVYLPSDGGIGVLRILLTVVAARAVGMELVLHHHTFFYIHRRVGLMTAICRAGGRRLHHVFLCECMREGFLGRYAVAGDWTVASNAAFVPLGPGSGSRDRSGPLRVGMFGNLMAAKGLPDFLEVAARLHGDDRVELHVGGKVEPDMVDGLAAALDAGHVVHHGALYGEDKVTFLHSLDLLVFPSRYVYEAEPLVVWEAIALGVPVVAYPLGCLGEQVSASHLVDGVDELEGWVRAFVADPGPVRALAAERHAAMARLAEASRERFAAFVGAGLGGGGPAP